jgi:hypothetical protein
MVASLSEEKRMFRSRREAVHKMVGFWTMGAIRAAVIVTEYEDFRVCTMMMVWAALRNKFSLTSRSSRDVSRPTRFLSL